MSRCRHFIQGCILLLSLGSLSACGGSSGPILWLQLSNVPMDAVRITFTVGQGVRSVQHFFFRDMSNRWIPSANAMGMSGMLPANSPFSTADLALSLPAGTSGHVTYKLASDKPRDGGMMPGGPLYLSDVCGEATVTPGEVTMLSAPMVSPPHCP